MIEINHQWDYCGLCECPFVRCRTCGNNCCNGSYGQMVDGETCDDCVSAYEMQDNEIPPEFSEEYIQEAICQSDSFWDEVFPEKDKK
jgi:hypothetical protein